MVTDIQILKKIDAANRFIDKSYFESLQDYHVHPLDAHLRKHNLTRLFHIEKIVYDKNEDRFPRRGPVSKWSRYKIEPVPCFGVVVLRRKPSIAS